MLLTPEASLTSGNVNGSRSLAVALGMRAWCTERSVSHHRAGPTRSLKPRGFALSRSQCGPIRNRIFRSEVECFLCASGGPGRTRICDLYRVKVAL
jgi:hypothetical protein